MPSHIEEREEVLPVKGDPTTVKSRVRVCEICGGDCSDNELLDQTLRKAYDKYREKHGIISRGEIESILKKYNISQRSLAALLGWGEITIHRYVAGNIPDEAHNQMLHFIADPANMEKIFCKNEDRLSLQARRKLETALNTMTESKKEKSRTVITSPQDRLPISIYTGSIKFSEESLRNMVLYFASQAGGVLKTKLMKLLWYAENVHFSLHSTSISGTTYVHLPHGPAPDDYEFYLSEMKLDNDIIIEETLVGDFPGYILRAAKSPDLSSLPGTAEPVLKAVREHFENFTSGDISRVSHAEPGYVETGKGKPISFEYAGKLKEKINI